MNELLKKRRNAVIDELTDAFSADAIEMEEFERRLALAHRAEEQVSLDAIVADLPKLQKTIGPETALAHSLTPAVVVQMAPPRLLTVLGSTTRKGVWKPPAELRVHAILGSSELDLRDAVLPPGVTEFNVKAVFGSVEIIVPPHLAVEVEGTAVLGTFDHVERAPSSPDPSTPVLRIRGLACFGSVEVVTRVRKK